MEYNIEDVKNFLLSHETLEDAIIEIKRIYSMLDLSVDEEYFENCIRNEDNLLRYEKFIGMYDKKLLQQHLHRNNNEKGRYWLALAPRWIEKVNNEFNTTYKIGYWANYADNNTYGWFTVEQILEWFNNPKIQLWELGGTKER